MDPAAEELLGVTEVSETAAIVAEMLVKAKRAMLQEASHHPLVVSAEDSVVEGEGLRGRAPLEAS